MSSSDSTGASDPQPRQPKPWPMSWVVIVILIYVTLQVGYYLFFGE